MTRVWSNGISSRICHPMGKIKRDFALGFCTIDYSLFLGGNEFRTLWHRAYKKNGFPWVFVGRVPSRGVPDEFSKHALRVCFSHRPASSSLVRDSMNTILCAILDNDQARVTKLLKADRGLAVQHVENAKLYESKIFH